MSDRLLQATLKLRDKNFSRNIKTAGKNAESFGKKAKNAAKDAAKQFEKLTNSAARYGAIAGGVVIAALASQINKNIELAIRVDNTSRALGISTDKIQENAYAARIAGIQASQLDKAYMNLTKNMSDAAQGKGLGKEWFDRLGISVTDATGKLRDTDSVLEEVADAIESVEGESTKAAIAMDIFGKRAGKDMAAYLSMGSEGIRNLRTEAHELGAVMSKDDIIKARQLGDDLDRLRVMADSAGREISGPLVDDLAFSAKQMVEYSKTNRGLSKDIGEGISWAFTRTKELFGSVAAGSVKALGNAEAAWLSLKATMFSTYAGMAEKMEDMFAYLPEQGSWSESAARALPGVGALIQLRDAVGDNLEVMKAYQNDAAALTQQADALKKAVDEEATSLLSAFIGPDTKPAELGPRATDSTVSAGLNRPPSTAITFHDAASGGAGKSTTEKLSQEAEETAQWYDTMFEQRQAAIDRTLEQYSLSQMSERELLYQHQEQELQAVGNHEAARAAIKAKYAEKLTKFEAKRKTIQFKNAANFFGTMTKLTETAGNEQSAIHKKFAMFEAVTNTWAGATRALRLPWPENLVAFAQTLATGKGAIDSIKGSSPGTESSGTANSGAGDTSTTVPAIEPVPTDTVSTQQQNKALFINFAPGMIIGPENYMREQFIPELKSALADGEDAGFDVYLNGSAA